MAAGLIRPAVTETLPDGDLDQVSRAPPIGPASAQDSADDRSTRSAGSTAWRGPTTARPMIMLGTAATESYRRRGDLWMALETDCGTSFPRVASTFRQAHAHEKEVRFAAQT